MKYTFTVFKIFCIFALDGGLPVRGMKRKKKIS